MIIRRLKNIPYNNNYIQNRVTNRLQSLNQHNFLLIKINKNNLSGTNILLREKMTAAVKTENLR